MSDGGLRQSVECFDIQGASLEALEKFQACMEEIELTQSHLDEPAITPELHAKYLICLLRLGQV